jgi:hypothetical protein
MIRPTKANTRLVETGSDSCKGCYLYEYADTTHDPVICSSVPPGQQRKPDCFYCYPLNGSYSYQFQLIPPPTTQELTDALGQALIECHLIECGKQPTPNKWEELHDIYLRAVEVSDG